LSALLKEFLGKLIPFIVRPLDKLTAHQQRNQPLTVRLESFGYAEESLVEGRSQKFQTIFVRIVCLWLSLLSPNAWTEESGHKHMMSGHDHKSMNHADMMSHESKPNEPSSEHAGHRLMTQNSTQAISNRDPHAYTNGKDFSGLSKPKMGDEDYLAALIVDRLEAVNVRDNFSTIYDWQAWYGKDYDKLLFRAEGEIEGGTFKNARNEALWAHALTAYWDTQVGIRIDSGLGVDRLWGAFGIQGFAPYWIYVEATGYVGEEGRTAFRLETEYDVLFTQKLILQPRIEMNFYSERDLSRLVSSGLSNIEAGLRLRYEFYREFAPYIGIEWASTFGAAADVIRASGKNPEETRFVAGVHFWF
jgi:copper resistance protein B